jgi:hypothetical protein
VRAEDRFNVDGVTCEIGGETLPVVNMSLGGFYVAMERSPLAGQVISTRINLPDGVSIAAAGRVAWVNGVQHRIHPRLPPGCGVQHLRVAFSDKLAIVAALRHVSLPLVPVRSATLARSSH